MHTLYIERSCESVWWSAAVEATWCGMLCAMGWCHSRNESLSPILTHLYISSFLLYDIEWFYYEVQCQVCVNAAVHVYSCLHIAVYYI